MKTWADRPVEIRNLYNPAFCGLLLHRSFQGYQSQAPNGIPYSLALLVLPVVLHADLRRMLLAHPKTRLLALLDKHQELLMGFPERARDMMPFTQEAFAVLAQKHCIEVTEDGRIQPVARRMRTAVTGTIETQQCQKASTRLGKEFALIGDRATIYTTLGVRP